jgi:hypothetical protein
MIDPFDLFSMIFTAFTCGAALSAHVVIWGIRRGYFDVSSLFQPTRCPKETKK